MKEEKGSSPKTSNENNAKHLGSLSSKNNANNGVRRKPPSDFNKLTIDDYEKIPKDKFLSKKLKWLKKIVTKIENRKPDKVQIPELGEQYKIKYRKELNKQQLAAVVTVDGPLMVIAGAGTGKTHLLTYRVLYLIESGVEPSDILLLTFTRKAAKEMMDRVNKERKYDSFYTEVSGGTFHSLAVRLIRQYHTYIGISPNFTIADKSKSESIIDLARTDLGFNKQECKFPAKSRIQEIISKARNTNVSIGDVIDKHFTGLKDYVEDIEAVYDWYSTYKENADILDFDDLIIVLRDKLRDDDDFRKIIQDKYRYIMVDEYQDTNVIQKELVDLMANEDQNVMIVGDDAQSIYSFRGADNVNILLFPDTYPGCKIIKLEKNYRSTQKLIDFTNSVNNSFKIGYKKLLKAFKKEKGSKPIVQKFMDQETEATFVVDKIHDLHENEIPYEKIAVLCRTAWFWQHIEKELNRRKIPYVTVGGTKFVEKAHIQDMLAYLTVLFNPMDAVAWHRILKLISKVGTVTARTIVEKIHEDDGELDSLQGNADYPAGVSRLFEMLEEADSEKVSIAEKFEIIKNYYKPILEAKDDSHRKSLLDIGVFQDFADGYDDLRELLNDFALDPFVDKFADKVSPTIDESEEGPVTLSTVHSAKGLEWGTVFIPHALDGLFPSSKAMNNVEDLEEEHRVFYVAATRAEDQLYITMPSSIGANGKFYSLPSRFLVEIDQDTFKYGEKKERKASVKRSL